MCFGRLATTSYSEWPAYDSTPLYERRSRSALEEDIRTVSEAWFDHEAHDSLEQFVCSVPLAYFRFEIHDRYGSSARYPMVTLFRVFVLKELHGWDHETALVDYLDHCPELCEQLDFEAIPDQSTLWRSWHERFTADLRETVERGARTILIKAQNAGVTVPREPERNSGVETTTLESRIQTIKPSWNRRRRSPSTSAESSSLRFRVATLVAVSGNHRNSC